MQAYPDGGWWCDKCHLYGPGEPESSTCPRCGEDLEVWEKSDTAAVASYVGPFDKFLDGPLIKVPQRTGNLLSTLFVVATFTFIVTLPIVSMDLLNGIYSVLTSPMTVVCYLSAVAASFIFFLVYTGLIGVKENPPEDPVEESPEPQEADPWDSKYL